MFENFAPSAFQVFAIAAKESIFYRHFFTDTEHALLGLIGDEGGVAGEALALYGVTEMLVRHDIDNLVGSGENNSKTNRSFTPAVKDLIDLSKHDAVVFHSSVGTGNILRAFCSMPEGVGFRILVNQIGLDGVADLRTHVLAILDADAVGQRREVPNTDSSDGTVR